MTSLQSSSLSEQSSDNDFLVVAVFVCLFLPLNRKLLLMTAYVFVVQQESKFYLDADIMFLNMGSLVEYYSTHVLPSHDSLILRCPYGYSKPR